MLETVECALHSLESASRMDFGVIFFFCDWWGVLELVVEFVGGWGGVEGHFGCGAEVWWVSRLFWVLLALATSHHGHGARDVVVRALVSLWDCLSARELCNLSLGSRNQSMFRINDGTTQDCICYTLFIPCLLYKLPCFCVDSGLRGGWPGRPAGSTYGKHCPAGLQLASRQICRALFAFSRSPQKTSN